MTFWKRHSHFVDQKQQNGSPNQQNGDTFQQSGPQKQQRGSQKQQSGSLRNNKVGNRSCIEIIMGFSQITSYDAAVQDHLCVSLHSDNF